MAGPLGRRHQPWMQECRLACWRAGWGFIRTDDVRMLYYQRLEPGKFWTQEKCLRGPFRKATVAPAMGWCTYRGTERERESCRLVHFRQKRNCVSNTRPNQCGAFFPDVITTKIQPGERRALPQHPPGGLFFDFIDVALSGRATISIGNGAGTWISPTSRPGARSRARTRLCIGWRSATVAQIVPDEDEYC